jgi:hypothetical protein
LTFTRQQWRGFSSASVPAFLLGQNWKLPQLPLPLELPVVASDVGAGVSPIPEPSTLALLAAGGVSLLAYAWRRRQAVS